MVHAKISPLDWNEIPAVRFFSHDIVMVAEECRVNHVLGRIGHDTTELSDGSEVPTAKRIVASGTWRDACIALALVLGTGSERRVVAELRKHTPWRAGVTALRAELRQLVATLSLTRLTSHDPELHATVTIANLLQRAVGQLPPQDSSGVSAFRRSLRPGGRRGPSGRFAELVWSDYPNRDIHGPRSSAGWRHDVVGTQVHSLDRLVRDSKRQIFRARCRTSGGVVLVDQSGSMAIEESLLTEFISTHPGGILLGYSHLPGDVGNTPNIWPLALDGGACTPRLGNVGNGVDGPALLAALSFRRHGEVVAWVTDGQVTDSNDVASDALARECSEIVREHGVRLYRGLESVLEQSNNPCNYGDFGRVGRALRDFS
jgi:hypothetical protein